MASGVATCHIRFTFSDRPSSVSYKVVEFSKTSRGSLRHCTGTEREKSNASQPLLAPARVSPLLSFALSSSRVSYQTTGLRINYCAPPLPRLLSFPGPALALGGSDKLSSHLMSGAHSSPPARKHDRRSRLTGIPLRPQNLRLVKRLAAYSPPRLRFTSQLLARARELLRPMILPDRTRSGCRSRLRSEARWSSTPVRRS